MSTETETETEKQPEPELTDEQPEYRYLGNFSAVDPAYSRDMQCHDCKVRWTGCWDNFKCPECHQGDLPTCKLRDEEPETEARL